MTAIGHHTALVWVMVVASASDGVVSERELKIMDHLTRTLPVFRAFEGHRLGAVVQDCTARLQDAGGEDTVLDQVRAALPAQLRETAYWLGLEVALSDARVTLEEVRMADRLRRALGLDRLTAAAFERAARARYQVA